MLLPPDPANTYYTLYYTIYKLVYDIFQFSVFFCRAAAILNVIATRPCQYIRRTPKLYYPAPTMRNYEQVVRAFIFERQYIFLNFQA